MKVNKYETIINFFLINILFFSNCIYSKKIYINEKNEEKSFFTQNVSPLSFILKEEDYAKEDFYLEKNINISISEVHTEPLYDSYIYKFDFFGNNKESDLLINFYPLDCQIKIAVLNDNGHEGIIMQSISNYENDAYSFLIPNQKINFTYFKIKPLINGLKENNLKRTYHLVINSFYKDNPQLFLNEKEPTLIYFDSNINKIKLFYNSSNLEEPLIFSFFIKERAKFEAKVMDDEKSKRIIAYKDNVIVNPSITSETNNNIFLTVNKITNKTSTLIVKVSGNSTYPYYLQKNLLNLGFMPINTFYHYYYMEVFKGERGEIMLHNKYQDGFLIGKIMKKDDITETNILKMDSNYFSNYMEENNFRYNNLTKRLDFSFDQTEDCENGCYLLITYYSPDINLENIDGIEYNLLVRIWEKEEIKSQIINIPLNEYIFGVIESSFVNYQYYSLFIPEENDIIIEIHGRNIGAFVKEGVIKMDIINENNDTKYIGPNKDVFDLENNQKGEEKLIFKLNKQNLNIASFEKKYISLAFFILNKELNFLMNYYYFRIIQDNSNNYIIYPLDTNKANICQTVKLGETNVCYFLLKNDYKELSNNFQIYAYGEEEANYKAWYINDTNIDYYSIDINNIKKQNKSYDEDPIFDNIKFILIELQSKKIEILNVYFNFDGELIPSASVDIFSYQIFYLKTNTSKDYYFNLQLKEKYKIFINNIDGEGYICFNKNCDEKKIDILEDIFLSFNILEIKSIHFFSKRNLLFHLKTINENSNDIMDEIDYGLSYKNITLNSGYSKPFYIKYINSKGLDIYFNFEFSRYNYIVDKKNMMIMGILLTYEQITSIKSHEFLEKILNDYYNNYNYIMGEYDYKTETGFISIDKNYANGNQDLYFLVTFYISDRTFFFDYYEFSLELLIDYKNNYQYAFQKNKYIKGHFLLSNETIQTKKFKIKITKEEEYTNKSYILEFSSNFEGTKLIFNKDFNYYDKRIIGGLQQYFISMKNLSSSNDYYFNIQFNTTNLDKNIINDQYLKSIFLFSYIIKFNNYKNALNQDFNLEKDFKFKKIKELDNNIFSYNFTISNKKINKNIDNYFKYSYSIYFYLKESLFKGQILNTISSIYYLQDDIFYSINGGLPLCIDLDTNDPNKDFSFVFNLTSEQEYIVYLIIKIKGNNNEESFYSNFFEFTDKKDDKKINTLLIILCSIFGTLFISMLFLLIFFFFKFKKKNKDLKGKIESISFTRGLGEESRDKKNNNTKSKNEEDYEITFI